MAIQEHFKSAAAGIGVVVVPTLIIMGTGFSLLHTGVEKFDDTSALVVPLIMMSSAIASLGLSFCPWNTKPVSFGAALCATVLALGGAYYKYGDHLTEYSDKIRAEHAEKPSTKKAPSVIIYNYN